MIKKGLKYLVRILFFPLVAVFYLLGWALKGIAWIIRGVLFQFYAFKKYMGWVIR